MNKRKYKKQPTGDKCLKCLNGNHLKCVAWTCMCTFCASTVEKQREKTIRLEEYWSKKNIDNSTLDSAIEMEEDEEFKGKTKIPLAPEDLGPPKRNKNYFDKDDDFYDENFI
jgi:hypothetical protein